MFIFVLPLYDEMTKTFIPFFIWIRKKWNNQPPIPSLVKTKSYFRDDATTMTIFSLLCKANATDLQFRQIRPKLYRTAYSWCHNSELADDLVQEALAKGIKSLKQLHDPAQFNSWLFKIMTNCWRDYYRRHREMDDIEAMDESLYVDGTTPVDDHAQSQIVLRVRDAVTKLPMGQRQVVTLVDLAELSYAEVAEVLAIPIGTVMSRLCRARLSLQLLLKEHAPETPVKTSSLRSVT